ncbi:GGDEF domain-containing protein [Stutzerimonas stutzeri]|uniref:diguanylate cyclase n=1 Tax=Stutzerimonas stutzeri TaxID=316 RepID=A0AA40V8J6_STUST|nr:diguanylate cyclase [Stutzerimonas stutzeri]MBA1305968.1 diguanylate cyclase [Stutzerimonas stutzeri]
MKDATINLVLQGAWRALVLARPNEAGLGAFRAEVFKARAERLRGPQSEFSRALTELARAAGLARSNTLGIEGIGRHMEILQAASRRANDAGRMNQGPGAVYVEGFGDRAKVFAEGLAAAGFQIIQLEPELDGQPKTTLRELMPRSGVVLIGSGVIGDPVAATMLRNLAAVHESDMLVVIAADGPLTFEQRVAATDFGAVRLLSPDADPKALRTLVRSRDRDSQLNGYRVLLLDDSRTDAYVAQKYMRDEGLEVMHVQDPTEVLDAITTFRPDIVVTDFHMPGANGDQVASVIRQDHNATMPIIFLSSERNAETQLRALARGADAFVQKPLRRGAFITALKSLISRSRAVETRMHRDPLTGLLNHGEFLGAASRINATRGSRPVALVMIDIDFFKQVNDAFGHPVGDQVLVGLAEILTDNLRSSDAIGRMGGEEFAVVMDGATLEEARGVIDRLRAVFASVQFAAEGAGDGAPVQWFTCSFSAGVAMLEGEVAGSLKGADEALYRAKHNGRNKVEIAG